MVCSSNFSFSKVIANIGNIILKLLIVGSIFAQVAVYTYTLILHVCILNHFLKGIFNGKIFPNNFINLP